MQVAVQALSPAQRAWATRRAAAGLAYAPGTKAPRQTTQAELTMNVSSARVLAVFPNGERFDFHVSASGETFQLSGFEQGVHASKLYEQMRYVLALRRDETQFERFHRYVDAARASLTLAQFTAALAK